MGNPRLKFDGKEFGLRQIDDGLFELKSTSIFQKAVNSSFNISKSNNFFVQQHFSPFEPEQYHKIESFCFVTTDNIKREAAMLLKSLRKFHDQPVYIICDESSKRFLVNEGLKDDNVFCKLVAEKDDLDNILKETFYNHKCIANKVHKPAEILLKMEVMEMALRHHNNTFFLDSDIIVLDNLQEYFQSKIILSPHYYPEKYLSNGFENGFYNAGYIFCASKGFPKLWRHMYLNDSIFFEQECMNRIPDVSHIQTFDREHNVGFWRRDQIPKHIKSLHFHITKGVDKNRNAHLRGLNENIKNIGVDYMKAHHEDIYNYYRQMTESKKVAFVHFGKVAGVYINEYLKSTCLKQHLKYFSWHPDLNPYGVSDRDWTKEELHKIAKEADDYSFLQQHHINWDKETTKIFKDNGWFIFTFIRRPEELLCSLYHWSKEQSILLRSPDPEPESLEEIFDMAVHDEHFARLWTIPDYVDELDYVAEFNNKNFERFLLDNFGEVYEPRPKLNTSSNKGFTHYREAGEISDRIAWQFLLQPEYKRFLNYL
tara:strand:+ start:1 stop:1620 length:1620 start_codon:yes stop_codon:yes gene_type:complete